MTLTAARRRLGRPGRGPRGQSRHRPCRLGWIPVLVLVIDTSSAATLAALASVDDGVSVLAMRRNVDPRAHGEVLAPAIAGCLDDAGAAVTAICARSSPASGRAPTPGCGSGWSPRRAGRRARQIPTYGVCSLDGIGALTAGACSSPAMPAGARSTGPPTRDGRREAGPDVAKPADVATDGFSACAGAGARLYADVLGLPLLDHDYPDPAALAGARRRPDQRRRPVRAAGAAVPAPARRGRAGCAQGGADVTSPDGCSSRRSRSWPCGSGTSAS